MRVVCDNCSAVYKIPDDKLVKPVNKATCRACGHRMLIPRPPRADEFEDEERTLIKERPVTAMHSDSGDRVTSPIPDDEPEATLPRVKPPLAARPPRPTAPSATPRGARPRDRIPRYPDLPRVASAAHRRPGPNVQVFTADDEHTVWVKDRNKRPAAPARGRDKLPPDEQPTRPARPISDVSPAAERRAGSPAPARREERHDPSADLGLAMIALLAGMIGVFLLSVNVPTGSPWIDLAIGLLTSMLALGGLFIAFLVLWTSGRGRKPASRILAVLGGVSGSLVVAALLVGIRGGVAHVSGAGPLWQPAEPPSTAGVLGGDLQEPEPTVAPEPADDALADAGTDELAVEPVAAPVTPVVAPSRPAPRPVYRPDPSPAPEPSRPPRVRPEPEPVTVLSVPSPSPAPAPEPSDIDDLLAEDALPDDAITLAPEPEPEPARPAPAPAPSPDALDEVPMEALDLMLRNNLEVKKCFFDHMQAAGSLPARVDVRFTLETSGTVSAVNVTQSAFAGTDLERCLRTAIMGIQFPPTKQSKKITYPFIFQ